MVILDGIADWSINEPRAFVSDSTSRAILALIQAHGGVWGSEAWSVLLEKVVPSMLTFSPPSSPASPPNADPNSGLISTQGASDFILRASTAFACLCEQLPPPPSPSPPSPSSACATSPSMEGARKLEEAARKLEATVGGVESSHALLRVRPELLRQLATACLRWLGSIVSLLQSIFFLSLSLPLSLSLDALDALNSNATNTPHLSLQTLVGL